MRHTATLAGLSATALLLAGCATQHTSSKVPNTRQSLGEADPVAGDADAPFPYAIIDGERTAVPDIEMGDARTIAAILDEGLNKSQVLAHLKHLCEEIGPRLTGSSQCEQANRWSMSQFESWGLDASLNRWGEVATRFDRGPSSAKLFIPDSENPGEFREVNRDIALTTLAWSAGTDGPVRGHVVIMPRDLQELEDVRDELEGAWVMLVPAQGSRTGIRGVGGLMRTRTTQRDEARDRLASGDTSDQYIYEELEFEGEPYWVGTASGAGLPDAGWPIQLEVRLEEIVEGTFNVVDLHEGPIENATWNPDTQTLTYDWTNPSNSSSVTLTRDGETLSGTAKASDGAEYELTLHMEMPEGETIRRDNPDYILEQVLAQNPAGFISNSRDERVWTTSANGWRERAVEDYPTDVEINVSEPDFDHLLALMHNGETPTLEVDLEHNLTEGPIPVYNTIAEIKGTQWPDEVIIVSAHLDSWNGPGSMGTVDNGTGSAVTMEAARILAAAGAQPKRTIRFILWTGEEQGLLGSREYVNQLRESGELDNVSCVFVDDGGTNYQGGLNGIESMVPLLAAASAPINGQSYDHHRKVWMDVNVKTLDRMPRGGGSDHASFNRAGVPGFYWDEVGRANYRYAWHTQHDKIDQAVPEYLMQSATCSAITAYNLACAPTMLPRQVDEEDGD